MKFGNNEVLEVTIFDDSGNLVTTLDTLKNSSLSIVDEGKAYLVVRDALLDDKLLKFIGKYEEDTSSDFDKYLKKQKYGTTITFNRKIDKLCKIIGKGILRKSDDLRDKEFIFEIPFAKTGRQFTFEKNMDYQDPSEFDFTFTAYPYNDEGDLLKMHIE